MCISHFSEAVRNAMIASIAVLFFEKGTLQKDNDSLRQQITELEATKAAKAQLEIQLSQLKRAQLAQSNQAAELARLRSEVVELRQRTNDVLKLQQSLAKATTRETAALRSSLVTMDPSGIPLDHLSPFPLGLSLSFRARP